MSSIEVLRGWEPPADWQRFETIDMHTGGEPLRVIVSGLPDLPGASVLDKRRWFATHCDHIRMALMWEPRGHADMYGAVITPSAQGDFDVFFLHNEGYSTMCGHAVLALAKLLVETGMIGAGRTDMRFEVPCGTIAARANLVDGAVQSATFRNVPSYVALSDASVEVPGIGMVRFDIAYGGAYYAIVDAAPLELALDPSSHDRLIDAGRRIKRAVAEACPVAHPFEPELSFLYGTIFTGPAQDPRHHSRNVCIFADSEVDRSPTGSGVSARAALHHLRGDLGLGETMVIESILGSTMAVRIYEEVRFGQNAAVVPEVTGSAHFTGRSSFWIDPADPLGPGFLLR